MTFVIAEPCIDVKDASCIEVCPVDCIHTDEDDRICYIDPEACTDCNACLPACPVGAIHTDLELPDGSRPFLEINARWFTDKAAARLLVDQQA